MSKISCMDLKLCKYYYYDICGHSLLLPANPTPYWLVGLVCYSAHVAQLGGICSELPIGVISVKSIALKYYTEMLNIYGMLVQNLQCLGLKYHYNRCIITEITAIESYGQIPQKSALCVIYTFVLAMV